MVDAVADERFAGVDLVAMKRAAVVAVAYDSVDDDARSRWLLVDGCRAVQLEAQTHHIQSHKFHLLPYRTDNLTAVTRVEKKHQEIKLYKYYFKMKIICEDGKSFRQLQHFSVQQKNLFRLWSLLNKKNHFYLLLLSGLAFQVKL